MVLFDRESNPRFSYVFTEYIGLTFDFYPGQITLYFAVFSIETADMI